MRISTAQMYQGGLDAILQRQSGLARTQEQISTGKRILSPADDPAGAANLLGIRQSTQAVQQYQENIGAARAQLQLEESTFGAVNQVFDRVREFGLQAINPALSDADRRSIATELRQRLDDLIALANTRNASGEYLFAGFQGHTRPFVAQPGGGVRFEGDAGQRLLQIGPDRQIAVNDSGIDLFMAVPRGNGVIATLAYPENGGDGVILPGTVTGAYSGEAWSITFPAATDATAALDFQDSGAADDLGYTLAIDGVAVYSVTSSETPAATLDEVADAINAATGATGVRALVADGTLHLVRTTPSDRPIEVSESMTGASDATDVVTGYFGSVLGDGTSSATLTLPAGDGMRYVVEDASGQVVAAGPFTSGEPIAIGPARVAIEGQPRIGDAFAIEPAGTQDVFATIDALADALEAGLSGPALENVANGFLANIDQAMEAVRSVRAEVGARLNALDAQALTNEDALLRMETSRSALEDLDYAEAITRFGREMVALEAAQRSFIQIQRLTLFEYLR